MLFSTFLSGFFFLVFLSGFFFLVLCVFLRSCVGGDWFNGGCGGRVNGSVFE